MGQPSAGIFNDVIHFTFTLLDCGGATSVAGNHSLAILKVPEKYDELYSGLQDLVSEASDLQALVVGGWPLKLQYFLEEIGNI